MNAVLDKLRDLLEQATKERSHYYVASTCLEAMAEIERLETLLAKADQENMSLRDSLRSETAKRYLSRPTNTSGFNGKAFDGQD